MRRLKLLGMCRVEVVWLMQGKKLDDGCSAEDYRITVGVANCTVVDFSSNQITCEPPVNKPRINSTWSSFCENSTRLLALMVSVQPRSRTIKVA